MIKDSRRETSISLETKGTPTIHQNVGTVVTPGMNIAIVKRHFICDVRSISVCCQCGTVVEVSQ